MKCEDILLLISSHLDGENTAEEDQALQAHLSVCAECRCVMQAFKEADAGLIQTKETAPEGLCAEVMAQIKKETAKKKYSPWLGIAAAAALTLVIGIGAVVERPEEPEAPQTVSAVQLDTMSRNIMADADTVAERISQEREAPVVVVRELYYELETCDCETLEEGYVLYTLPNYETAVSLTENYGCAIHGAADVEKDTVCYALLAP